MTAHAHPTARRCRQLYLAASLAKGGGVAPALVGDLQAALDERNRLVDSFGAVPFVSATAALERVEHIWALELAITEADARTVEDVSAKVRLLLRLHREDAETDTAQTITVLRQASRWLSSLADEGRATVARQRLRAPP